jgi:hypothetical protein
VTEESFNHPLGFLAAQFAALLSESNAFSTVLATLLSVLDKDTTLIDQLLAEAGLRSWASTIPLLTGGASILWDFGAGYGPITDPGMTLLWTDPASFCAESSYRSFGAGAGLPCRGITPAPFHIGRQGALTRGQGIGSLDLPETRGKILLFSGSPRNCRAQLVAKLATAP